MGPVLSSGRFVQGRAGSRLVRHVSVSEKKADQAVRAVRDLDGGRQLGCSSRKWGSRTVPRPLFHFQIRRAQIDHAREHVPRREQYAGSRGQALVGRLKTPAEPSGSRFLRKIWRVHCLIPYDNTI